MDLNSKSKIIDNYECKKKIEESTLYYNVYSNEYLLWFIIIFAYTLLISTTYTQKLNKIDNITALILMTILFILAVALLFKNIYVIDIIHVCTMFAIGIFSFYIKNFYLLLSFLAIILTIIIIWIFNKNECPMGRFETLPIVNILFNEYSAGYIVYIVLALAILRICYMVYKLWKN